MRSLKELMSLQGRVALITGGAGHLGQTFAEALAELGAAIAILDQRDSTCIQVADRIRGQYGADTLALSIDLAEESDVLQTPNRVLDQFGRLDILINAAAFVGTTDLPGWAVPFHKQLASTWRRALEVNLTAPFILTQVCADTLKISGHGSVINVGSTYGLVGPDMRLYEETPLGNPAAYAASKGGLLQMTRWLATVLAPEVRVNSITPGGVWRDQPEPFLKRYVDRTPLGRMAVEEDIKGAVAYLATDLSAYVTGHNLVVDGGWTAW